MSESTTDFRVKLRGILRKRRVSIIDFCEELGIDRANLFYRNPPKKHNRHTYMAIAYYLGMDVEKLIEGTDAENDFYGV